MLMLELRLVLKSMLRLDHNMDVVVDAIDHTTDVATEDTDVDVVAVVVVMVAMDTVDAIEEATIGDLILLTLYRTKMTL